MFSPAIHPWPPTPDGYFMHVGSFLQVTGTGTGPNKADRRDLAIRDAWSRLLDYIYSLPLGGYGHVKNKANEDESFSNRLQNFIYTAKIVETKHSGDTAAVVILIGKDQINNILETDFQ